MSEWITHRLPTEGDADVDGDVVVPRKSDATPDDDCNNWQNYGWVTLGQRWWPGNSSSRRAAAAEQESAAAAANPDPTPEPSAEPSPAVAGVPSDEELWQLQREARGLSTDPDSGAGGWVPGDRLSIGNILAHRALYDRGASDGYRRCLEEAKATRELNKGLHIALQEENAQLKSKVEEFVGEMQVLDRGLNNATRDLEYKERHLNGAYCRIKELERELERRGGEPEPEPEPAPEPAVRKAVQIAGHNNALSVMCDDGTVWLWTSYDGWTPYKTIPQTPIQ